MGIFPQWGTEIPYEVFGCKFLEDHTGTIKYYFCMNNGGSHVRGEHSERSADIFMDFNWSVLNGEVLEIRPLKVTNSNEVENFDNGDSIKFKCKTVTTKSLSLYTKGILSFDEGNFLFVASTEEPDLSGNYSVLYLGEKPE